MKKRIERVLAEGPMTAGQIIDRIDSGQPFAIALALSALVREHTVRKTGRLATSSQESARPRYRLQEAL